MTRQIILFVILALVLQLTAGNILVRQLDGAKKPRIVRTLNQAGSSSKIAEDEGWCCRL